jgi:hypothetical protein
MRLDPQVNVPAIASKKNRILNDIARKVLGYNCNIYVTVFRRGSRNMRSKKIHTLRLNPICAEVLCISSDNGTGKLDKNSCKSSSEFPRFGKQMVRTGFPRVGEHGLLPLSKHPGQRTLGHFGAYFIAGG